MSMSASSNNFLNLAAPGIQALQPYLPGKPVAELEREYGITNAVKLASNENPYGPSPLALAAARDVLDELSRYPEGGGWLLAGRLAQLHGLDRDRVTLGNGSNDVLDLIARVFLTPAHEAVFSQYAFAVYPIAVQAAGAKARIERRGRHRPDNVRALRPAPLRNRQLAGRDRAPTRTGPQSDCHPRST